MKDVKDINIPPGTATGWKAGTNPATNPQISRVAPGATNMAGSQDTSYEDALNKVTLQSLLKAFLPQLGPNRATKEAPISSDLSLDTSSVPTLESMIGKPQQKSSEPDTYTQAIQGVHPLDALIAGVVSVAETARQGVQNALDVGSYLPLPENPVVKSLLLDHAVAATTQADVFKQITDYTETANDSSLPPSSSPSVPSSPVDTIKTTTQIPTSIAEPVISSRANDLLQAFHGTWPNRNFNVKETDGTITVQTLPDKREAVSIVPLNHNTDTAAIGLKDLTRQLQSPSLSDKDRLGLAFDLKARVATQSAAMFSQYERQANAEQGIDALVQQLATSRQLDLRSPHVMSQGGLSEETSSLQQELARARTVASSRVGVLMKEDPVINEAETIANTTILKLQTQASFDAKSDADIVRDQKRQQYESLIAQYKGDQSLLNRTALMKTGKPLPLVPGADTVMATQLANNAIHFDKDETAIIGMPKETLNGQYLLTDPKNEVMHVKMKNVMLWEEANALRGKVSEGQEVPIALNHFKLWQAKVDRPLSREGGVPDAMLQEFNREGGALQAKYQGAELAKQQHALAITYKLKMLDDTVRGTQFADVRSWGGAFQSDLTTQAVLAQHQTSAPGKPFPSKEFVTAYMNYNDGANKADKVSKLRSMVIDSVNAMPDSIFFPKPDPESFASAIDKQIVGGFMQQLLPYLSGVSQLLGPVVSPAITEGMDRRIREQQQSGGR